MTGTGTFVALLEALADRSDASRAMASASSPRSTRAILPKDPGVF